MKTVVELKSFINRMSTTATYSIELIIWICIWKGILTHGPSFGIIVSRIDIKIQKIFCSVLPNTQIPDSKNNSVRQSLQQ